VVRLLYGRANRKEQMTHGKTTKKESWSSI
jgi:hypothetical protein